MAVKYKRREKMRRFIAVLIMAFIVLSVGNLPIEAKDKYPTRPVIFIVTSGIGGMTDASSRLLADKMKKIIDQPIAVTNRPGGGGLVGLNAFLTTKKDAYTLCVTTTTHLNAPPFLKAKSLDLNRFKFVGSYMPQERVLFAQANAPYNTLEEFITYAKKKPGKVSAGSGNCIWALKVMQSIGVKEGLDMNYVLFKSGADASSNLLGGHVDVAETGVGTPAFQAARAGKLKIIADLGSGSVPYFPDVKNIIDEGYPYYSRIEYGIVMHAAVSEELRQYWENVLRRVMEDAVLLKRFLDMGLVPRFLPGTLWKDVAIEHINMAYDIIEYTKSLEK